MMKQAEYLTKELSEFVNKQLLILYVNITKDGEMWLYIK